MMTKIVWKKTPSLDADEIWTGIFSGVGKDRIFLGLKVPCVPRFVSLVERNSKVFYPCLSTLFSFVAVAVYSSHMD